MAAAVTVHSPGNKEHVARHGGRTERVYVVYNWVDTERIRPGGRDNGFARQHGLADRFVVSYAGTMGWAQDMQAIIEAAAHLRDQTGILFLLVGDGVEKAKARAQGEALELDNVLWLPMQPWSVYPEILAASDVSMINLSPALHTPVVPSKLLSIMAAARPVVASLPRHSDARGIITQAGCGICVEAGDGRALADAILEFYSDRALAEESGRRGRAYAEAHFSRPACVGRVEDILKSVAGEVR
jgi:glycosyltransferase involved in cell wall biosynthesis